MSAPRDDDTPHMIIPSGLVICPACGRPQTADADGRPTPHATVIGGSQICAGRAPVGRPS